MVSTVLTGAALLSTNAGAQDGCCLGGLAPGANMWTGGNATSDVWPPNPPLSGAIPGYAPNLPLKAPPPPYWWVHGEIEFGGRGFINDPMRDGSIFGNTSTDPTTGGYAFLGQKSLAKYYEYSTIAPGAFAGGHVATGTTDGLYQVDLWANNIGYSDQAYLLTASKIGEWYFWAQWDQTPHLYSTSALTPYLGIGTSALTLPFTKPITSVVELIPFLHKTDIGIERDTASAGYRWTPTPEWDVNVNYSHMDRTGTQVAGITKFSNNFRVYEVPAPVDDTTHNFGADGEYVGTSPWGQRFTFKAAYNGSVYRDNISSYFTQNPFAPTTTSCTPPTTTTEGTINCVGSQTSTWPSNAANAFSGTASADLPYQSRYVGTLSYTMMTQNDPFQPMTNNPNAAPSPNGAPWNSVAALPALSLNGEINTLLSNNVLTTKITPELTSKISYRFYDFDNQTPRIIFPCWIHYDSTGTIPSLDFHAR
jgi:MtrB/PioB family decaheme-associated outer membrane protein